MTLFDISDKNVLITGSTQGIGYELARGFIKAGATVYLNARKPEKLEDSLSNLSSEELHARGAVFDVTDQVQVKQGIKQVMDEVGQLDVLINNAGIVKREKLETMKLADWEDVIKTDLTSPFIVSQQVVKHMINQGSGKIINICSLMSELGRDTVGAYAAAKGGLKMLTRNMATEWARYNIQINGIGPGYIATPINTQYRQPGNPLNDYIISRTPAQRWGRPEDLIGSALFLASAASDFINGQIIYVDGGLLATFGNPEANS